MVASMTTSVPCLPARLKVAEAALYYKKSPAVVGLDVRVAQNKFSDKFVDQLKKIAACSGGTVIHALKAKQCQWEW